MFRNRLQKVYRHLSRQATRLPVSCYRVYDHDLPEFPFRIEFYGDHLYVAEYKRRHGMSEAEHELWLDESIRIISEVLSVPEQNIFLKLRQRKAGRAGQYQKRDSRKNEFVVEEGGLKFMVNLSDYLDTGLFTDHRITRQMVRDESEDKSVLNLFAYTGSFSVYAAAGGAKEVVTVDLSNTYLKWAERNMQLNGFSDAERFHYVRADVKEYLKELHPGHFDLVIMDPPTFSNSKKMDEFLDIQRDHVALIGLCLRAMKKGGVLFFSTNYSKFILEKEKIAAASIKDITSATTPFDFTGKMHRYCFRIAK
ncbi:MAG: class I SAM-dependent methyltransferase [Chitinophagaceae bacterium]|nr:class I SAM-dependent methyltransferase [Chitinophagaceae bacterium]OQY95078.1 MAG: SAM-dependent methyltransferase [Sphingobacteriales bacterium UTBCD1]